MKKTDFGACTLPILMRKSPKPANAHTILSLRDKADATLNYVAIQSFTLKKDDAMINN